MLFFCLTVSVMLAPSMAQRPAPVKQSTGVGKYIGLRHGQELPQGLKRVGGSLVAMAGEEKGYGMTEVLRGTTRMLWFERVTHLDDKGIPYWEVKDVMVLPRLPRKQVLAYYGCLLNNRADNEIAAVLDYEPDVEYFTRARRTWRANRQTGKFEVIPTKGVKCENLGFGM
jgi:hypothetical protein